MLQKFDCKTHKSKHFCCLNEDTIVNKIISRNNPLHLAMTCSEYPYAPSPSVEVSSFVTRSSASGCRYGTGAEEFGNVPVFRPVEEGLSFEVTFMVAVLVTRHSSSGPTEFEEDRQP